MSDETREDNGMTIATKHVIEFGREVTLYQAVSPDGWRTLWHSTETKAIEHFQRRQGNARS